MRRKSERTASKKAKTSPEKKVEKVKRTRRGHRKQSSSSENESADEKPPVQETQSTSEVEQKPPQTPVKEDSPEEAQDQVWQVKTSDSSGDAGEIQKLKICLTRPSSTPERADRSPRSKRKHSRATSSSDTPSVEGDDKKKTKRSRKTRECKDDKGHDSHGEEPEAESEAQQEDEKSNNEVSQSDTTNETVESEAKEPDAEVPMSTTNDEVKVNETETATESSEQAPQAEDATESEPNKTSDADTTVVSPEDETRVVSPTVQTVVSNSSNEKDSPQRKRSLSVDKSDLLELHADESKCECSDNETAKPKEEAKDEPTAPEESPSKDKKVSTIEEIVNKESGSVDNESNKPDVVVSSDDSGSKKMPTESSTQDKDNVKDKEERPEEQVTQVERSDSVQSTPEGPIPNGQAAPTVVARKRRWGSRSSKLTTQKSITISTDVLKEIIPDVKPVEFDEVIEEKKHKRIEIPEKVERPVLPKIVIDNTENVENRKQLEEKERDSVRSREPHLASNRKISIVKDNDSIIARPPSPPRNKQSCILYITNLVRPFTLAQLKNLLQRTGRIAENGFWIDSIKSKCYVKYETEDQAVETRHALHGVTWPVSNRKTLQVDFSTEEAFEKAKLNEDKDSAPVSTIPGTVEDWLREQDMKRERGELEKPWERKASTREWDLGKNEKDKDKDNKLRREERPMDKRRHRSPEKSPEPARKFKKKEEEAPAKLLDDLFRKTKTTPCIYWLPLSAETIAVKEEQRRQHMAEHERRLQELRRSRRH